MKAAARARSRNKRSTSASESQVELLEKCRLLLVFIRENGSYGGTIVQVSAYLPSRCHAGGVFWSASSHRGCMSEDMLLETGFGDEKRLGCTGESGEVGRGGRCVCVCVEGGRESW